LPDFHRPTVETPVEWHDSQLSGQITAVDPQWWHAFGSAELDHLITESLLYNNDFAAAGQRVEQARAQAKIAGAGLWPTVGLQGNFADTHNNKGETGQLDASNVVDLWGANRANRDAGSALILSSVFAKDALQSVVMSNVGQAYFNLLDRLGAINYQILLNTQQSLLTTQNSQVQARQSILIAMVLLYQALDGGWFQA
jgi:multidrug efflux system outer membrane protein